MSNQDIHNLTLIQQNAINADCLSPTAFIASTYYPAILKAITGDSTPNYSIVKDQSNNNYYTRNKLLFLAYIRYCFNGGSEVLA